MHSGAGVMWRAACAALNRLRPWYVPSSAYRRVPVATMRKRTNAPWRSMAPSTATRQGSAAAASAAGMRAMIASSARGGASGSRVNRPARIEPSARRGVGAPGRG